MTKNQKMANMAVCFVPTMMTNMIKDEYLKEQQATRECDYPHQYLQEPVPVWKTKKYKEW